MLARNCLVCYELLTPAKRQQSSPTVVLLSSDDEEEIDGDCGNRLEEQLSMIFLLREVFELPKHKLVKYFDRSKGCNPSRWGIGLCRDCKRLLETLQKLFGELNKIKTKYNAAKESLYKQVWQSYMITGRVSGSLTDETREFITDNDYSHLSIPTNPFRNGDVLAKNLLPPRAKEPEVESFSPDVQEDPIEEDTVEQFLEASNLPASPPTKNLIASVSTPLNTFKIVLNEASIINSRHNEEPQNSPIAPDNICLATIPTNSASHESSPENPESEHSTKYTTETGRKIMLSRFPVETRSSGKGFQCPFCTKQFTHSNRLRVHGLVEHIDVLFSTARLSGVGDAIFKEYCETALTSNISPDPVTKQEIKARCSLCSLLFTDRRNLQKHWFFYHFEVLSDRLQNLQNPIQYSDRCWHIGPGKNISSFPIEKPKPKTAKSSKETIQMFSSDPLDRPPLFKCTFSSCELMFDTSGKLKEHAVQYHPEEFFPPAMYAAQNVPLETYRKLCLRLFDDQKVKAIGNNMYSCPKCQQGYLSLSPVWVHLVESHHSDLSRNLLCILKDSKGDGSTEVQPRSDVPQPSIRANRKYPAVLQCDACEKHFSMQTSLYRHRNFFCPVRRQQGLLREPASYSKRGRPAKNSNPLLRNLLGAPADGPSQQPVQESSLIGKIICRTLNYQVEESNHSLRANTLVGMSEFQQNTSVTEEMHGTILEQYQEHSELCFEKMENGDNGQIEDEETYFFTPEVVVDVKVKDELSESCFSDDDPLG